MQINDSNYPPSRKLYAEIKAGFVRQEKSLTAWCRENKLHTANVREAVYGSWDGKRAKELRHQVIKASGLVTEGVAS